jgi:tRNA dimethylallyltransferase
MKRPLNTPNTKYLLVIAGPTAVGKTALSVKIAHYYNTVILNADSRQLYKELQIGTARPTSKDMDGIRHFFTGNLSLSEDYNAGKFEKDALQVLSEQFTDKDLVVLSGGSGMYIDAVCQGFDEMPVISQELRNTLENELTTKGLPILAEELKQKDPNYYKQADIYNPRRVTRALEVIRSTGKKFSELRKKQAKKRPFSIIKIGLHRNREELYERINLRMDMMLQQGLLNEARKFDHLKKNNALQTVGYKEIYGFLNGEYDWDETVRLLKRNTRRFAKRQMTWFRKDPAYHWFHPEQEKDILEHIKRRIEIHH